MDRICSWFSFSFQIGRKLPPGSLFVDANFPWGWGLGGGPWTGVLRPGAMLPNLACISSKGGFGLLSALLQSRTWVLARFRPGRTWRRLRMGKT